MFCSLAVLVAIQPRITLLASNTSANQKDELFMTDSLSFILQTVEVPVFCNGFLRKPLPDALLEH